MCVCVCVCMCVHASVHAKICLLVFFRYSDDYRTSQSNKVEQTIATLCSYTAWNVGVSDLQLHIYICMCVCVSVYVCCICVSTL